MGQRRSPLEAAALAKARWRRARRAQISFRKSWRPPTTIVATTLLARAFALVPRLAVAGRRLPRYFVDGTDEGWRWTLVLAISPAAVASLLLVRRHVLAGEAFARPVIASPSPLGDAFGQLPAVDGPRGGGPFSNGLRSRASSPQQGGPTRPPRATPSARARRFVGTWLNGDRALNGKVDPRRVTGARARGRATIPAHRPRPAAEPPAGSARRESGR